MTDYTDLVRRLRSAGRAALMEGRPTIIYEAVDAIEQLQAHSLCGECDGVLVPTCVDCGTRHNP